MKSLFFYHFFLQLFSASLNRNSLFGKFLSVHSGNKSFIQWFGFICFENSQI
jgi:hypothetical protein